MIINRNRLATLTAFLVCSSGASYAGTLPFGVFGFPLDISANTKDTLLPGGTVFFQHSDPLFDTVQGESTSILDFSTGVNASGRSTNISGAFVSSLAAADGSGGVGVSQLIFGSPGGSGDGVRQLVGQSLWTQTFTYTGTFPVDITLHLHVPDLQVGLLGVPPRQTVISATETAQASGSLVRTITHPDLTIEGGHIEFGLSESEQQIPSGSDLLNIATVKVLGVTGEFTQQAPNFNGDDFNPSYTLDSFSGDVDLGVMHTGDILSYVYTLTAEGTTHAFERGYFAFVGDPFGVNGIGDNLIVTVTPLGAADAPEATTSLLMLSGLAGVLAWWRSRVHGGHKVYNRDTPCPSRPEHGSASTKSCPCWGPAAWVRFIARAIIAWDERWRSSSFANAA